MLTKRQGDSYSIPYLSSDTITQIQRLNGDGEVIDTTSYVYDSLNQLIRENNEDGGFTHVWTYDSGGNILSRTEYAYTTGALGTPTDSVTYKYEGAGDVLTEYDGTAIENYPLGIYYSDGWTYAMDYGNRLVRMYKWDMDAGRELAHTFTYNADGLRVKREEPNGTVYHYVYNGGLLSQMTVGSNTLYFTYDSSGTPLTVTHNGTTYYYATNLQGDVVAILGNTGTAVVTYTYDAWGNIVNISGRLALTLGFLNPLRYRGYVYDTETGWYYLQSRYYNPEWGRFLTADIYISTGQGVLGCNMFAYCLNNPVDFSDKNGETADSLFGQAGELIGELLYELITGETHPNKQTRALENQIIAEQNKMIRDAGKAIWDAYMRGYNIQQESQIRETQMVLEGAIKIYKYYNKHEKLQQGLSGGKRIATGALNIRNGFSAILVPVPTISEDLIGVAKITWGVINVCYGVVEAISASMR